MIKLKRGISALLAALIVSASPMMTAYASASPKQMWPQYRGDSRMFGTSDAKTPLGADKTEEKWKVSLNDAWTAPSTVILGDSLYTVYGSMMSGACSLQKRSLSDGSVQNESKLINSIGFFPYITYGDGKLFVSINNGRIEAFDADTLSPLWISESLYDAIGNDAGGQQSLAPIIYYNGYVYTGSTYGNAKTGMYYCVSADCDEIAPSDADEWKSVISNGGLKVNKFKWTYVPDVGKKGFYWSGGAIAGNAIVFGGDNGEIVSHSLTADTVYDKVDLNISGYSKDSNPSAIRSTVYYDRKTARVFVSSKEGCTVSSVIVKPDGTFSHSSLLEKVIPDAGNITSSPIVYNGRLYIGSGGMGGGSVFSVLDAGTLNLIYQVPIQTQSTPVLTTAYATAENHNTVYIYVAKYPQTYEDGKLKDSIYCIKDYEGSTKPDYTTLITPSVVQSNTCTLAIGNDGTLYYKNDSGNLFAFSNKDGGAYTAQDVVNAINRIPAEADLTVDDEIVVERARSRYDELAKSAQAGVGNYSKLTAAEAGIKRLKDMPSIIANLAAAINKLPDNVTLADQQTVYELLATYRSIPDKYKSSVTNSQRLLDAESVIERLADQKTVAEVIGSINALPANIHYDDSDKVYAAYQKYTALSDTLRSKVSNADLLLQKKKSADAVVNIVKSLNDDIWNKVNPSKITYADKDTVNDIISRYNALDSYDRQFIRDYDDVLDAQKTIAALTASISGSALEQNPATGDSPFGLTAAAWTASLSLIVMLIVKQTERRRKVNL